jgi:hypothetical protein
MTPGSIARWLNRKVIFAAALWLGLLGAAGATLPDEPPGRAGRVVEVVGVAYFFDHEHGHWAPAIRNRPVGGGDRLSLAADSRAELRIGSTTLRLLGPAELEAIRIDDDKLQFHLHSGSVAIRVRSREIADELEVLTREVRLRPLGAGHYRVDRFDDVTYVGVLRGELLVDETPSFPIGAGQRMELSRAYGRLQHRWSSLPSDALAEWVARDERAEQRSAAAAYVSPEMTGYEDLDRHGRWERHPEYGAVWFPLSVSVGWAPYRFGRWAWVRPWGWTWVDDAPWGFAPFHYGRWVMVRSQWCWVPGGYVARPAFAPALVGWIGTPNVSITIGSRHLPGSSWVPLAPWERWVPHHPVSPRYVDRINPSWPHPPRRPHPTGPIMYGNQGVPNGVTVVSPNVLAPRPGAIGTGLPQGSPAAPHREHAPRSRTVVEAPSAVVVPSRPQPAPAVLPQPAPTPAPTTIGPVNPRPVAPPPPGLRLRERNEPGSAHDAGAERGQVRREEGRARVPESRSGLRERENLR